MSKLIVRQALEKLLGRKQEAEIRKLTQLIALQPSAGTSKYKNLKCSYNGDKYDSISEAYFAYKLDELKKKKRVDDYKRQVRYKLPNMYGQMKLSYVADFVVSQHGNQIVVDVKGRLLKEAEIKLAYFRHYYKTSVQIVWTTGPEKFSTAFLEEDEN